MWSTTQRHNVCDAMLMQVMEFVEGNRVLEHILMRNKVLDGDNYVLHVQVSHRGCHWGSGGTLGSRSCASCAVLS